QGAHPPQRAGPAGARVPAGVRSHLGGRGGAVHLRRPAALGCGGGVAGRPGLAAGRLQPTVAARRGHGALVGGRSRPARSMRPPPGPTAVAGGTAELLADADRDGSWMLLVEGTPQSHVDLDDPAHLEFEYVRRMGHVLDLAAAPALRSTPSTSAAARSPCPGTSPS